MSANLPRKSQKLIQLFEDHLFASYAGKTAKNVLRSTRLFLAWIAQRGMTVVDVRTADIEAYQSYVCTQRQKDDTLYSIAEQTHRIATVKKLFRFLFRPAVYDSIVCIPRKWIVRMRPCQPRVERVVHEQVSKERADYPSLWSAFVPLYLVPVFVNHRGFQPSFHIEKNPFLLYMVLQCFHCKLMIHVVKESLDV